MLVNVESVRVLATENLWQWINLPYILTPLPPLSGTCDQRTGLLFEILMKFLEIVVQFMYLFSHSGYISYCSFLLSLKMLASQVNVVWAFISMLIIVEFQVLT